MSNSDKAISLNFSKFPQNLLISGIENEVKIHAVNTSSKKETYKFDFEGENLKIKVGSEAFNDHIEFGPGETKEITLKLEPTTDGVGKLIINVNWLKITEYKVKVQRVRGVVPVSKMNSILKTHVFSIVDKVDTFNSEDYFIHMDQNVIKKAEKQLESLRNELSSAQSMGSPTSQLLEKIDSYIEQIAKGYLSINNPLKALEYALMVSKSTEQIDLYTNLIRAYASKNFDQMVQLAQNMQDLTLKNKILNLLALDRIAVNPEQAITTTTLIPEPAFKEDLMSYIFRKIIETNPNLVVKLINHVDNDFQKTTVLFNVAKKFYGQEAQSEVINILNRIVQINLISYHKNQENKKIRKESYENLKDAINALAEYDSPNTAHSIIESITIQELKEKLTKNLFDLIYEMVDEIQTKIEATLVFSQYFLLNTYVSQVNREITNFSLTGGNVSSNLLANDFNFAIAFLSLFSFDFSIFPILDRVYNDLKYSQKKSIAYYLFPSKENYNQNELNTLKTSLKQFFGNLSNVPGQTLIFNLDFIPYLGKPTIIISSESELGERFYSKIKKMGEKIDLITDDSVFKGGRISHELAEIFPTNKTKIINLVLSYEFINDYDTFKSFIQSLF
ncbi:MAG: hypothetical protein ACFE9S_00115 [Candidatus Hermodarchaeota archaeon]